MRKTEKENMPRIFMWHTNHLPQFSFDFKIAVDSGNKWKIARTRNSCENTRLPGFMFPQLFPLSPLTRVNITFKYKSYYNKEEMAFISVQCSLLFFFNSKFCHCSGRRNWPTSTFVPIDINLPLMDGSYHNTGVIMNTSDVCQPA